jgi:hypothetical protein
MTEHTGLPVAGYRPQSLAAIDLVNANKAAEEATLRLLDHLATLPETDKRWLAIGRTAIENGFMAANRSVFRPARISLLALLFAASLAVSARAQTQAIITPAPVTGYATLSVLAASLSLSTATLGPNSPAFPVSGLPGRYIEAKNSPASPNILYVCPLGGTCTTAAGVPLAVGETKTWYVPSSAGSFLSPTVISGGTATAIVSW